LRSTWVGPQERKKAKKEKEKKRKKKPINSVWYVSEIIDRPPR
jgi:hypothetical protein